MTNWRVSWALAQTTGVLFSTMIWILVVAASPATAALMATAGMLLVAGRATRLGLWLRYAAHPAAPAETELVLAAVVPIVLRRGQGQPTVWIGRRVRGGAVLTGRQLLVDSRLVGRITDGSLTRDHVRRVVSGAVALGDVTSSAVVAVVEVYCTPWLIVDALRRQVAVAAVRVPLVSLAWRFRWLVFGIGAVQSAQAGRWAAAAAVGIVAVISRSTGVVQTRWERTLERLRSDADIEPGARARTY